MLEKLVENWLDSVNERSYQASFCQMLAGLGHTVLHSTRHSQIEFGKDVIAVDPAGNPCAYQLKGNPRARLTKRGFGEILTQVLELVNLPIVYPGAPEGKHLAYLVTNGWVEEEVQRQVDDLNRNLAAGSGAASKLEIIQRGTLLSWARDLGVALWPAELEDVDELLGMFVADGRGPLPFDRFHSLLAGVLVLEDPPGRSVKSEDLRRRVTSAALLTGVSTRAFQQVENHFSIIAAWTMFSTYAIASCERWRRSTDRIAGQSLDLAEAAVFDRNSAASVPSSGRRRG